MLVRDVPADVHSALQRRAAASGQSLQQFLSRELRRIAEQPTLEEVVDRLDRISSGRVGFDQAVADIEEGRSER